VVVNNFFVFWATALGFALMRWAIISVRDVRSRVISLAWVFVAKIEGELQLGRAVHALKFVYHVDSK
jgi:hypothetical protein